MCAERYLLASEPLSAQPSMAVMHSFNCASGHLPCDCIVPMEDSATGAISLNPTPAEEQVDEDKSLYKSKSCKYSFVASDYTSGEGEKLLSIQISSKRSISESVLFGFSEPLDMDRSSIATTVSAAQLSMASNCSLPACKICHAPGRPEDPLISPCRCAGTLRYIHCGCLMKWLEICNKRSRKPPTCELCKYQFHWHKKFKVGQWQFPHCSWQDKLLHAIFLFSVMIMIGCAIVTVLCFKQHQVSKGEHLELTQSEVVTLVCGALFFLAFFLAMYVEIKARNTLYKLVLKFIYLNQQWYIDEYDRKKETSAIDV